LRHFTRRAEGRSGKRASSTVADSTRSDLNDRKSFRASHQAPMIRVVSS
jgi:hypothetical protein